MPLDRGGDPWDVANLQSLCRGCHIRKTAGERFEELPPDVREWQEYVIAHTVTT